VFGVFGVFGVGVLVYWCVGVLVLCVGVVVSRTSFLLSILRSSVLCIVMRSCVHFVFYAHNIEHNTEHRKKSSNLLEQLKNQSE
jgi:hypothetical protein